MNNSNPDPSFSRRSVLRGGLGAFALSVLPASLLAACGSDDDKSSGGSGGGGGALTIGSNYSNDSVKPAFQAMVDAWGKSAKVNTVDHNTFQNAIQQYLQGTPDDVFTWFAGYRMQYFAAQGQLTQIDDVWDEIGGNFSDAMKTASKGADGHYYFVPIYNYPWVMCYRESVWDQKGYTVPTTWDELVALANKMKSDGITPIAIGDKDGWPAMGTFDIINMRMNGYQFHVDLMAHKEAWDDPKVVAVFDQWKQLKDFYPGNITGLAWDEAAKGLENNQSGMMFQGAGQVGQIFDPANLPDLKFFAFPEINADFGTDSIDAPIDGLMLSKKPKNLDAAKDFLKFVGTPQAEAAYLASDPTDVGATSNYDQSTYNDLQKASAQIIASTANIAQFLDRDTSPEFAYPIVENAIKGFLSDWDSGKATKDLESQAAAVFK